MDVRTHRTKKPSSQNIGYVEGIMSLLDKKLPTKQPYRMVILITRWNQSPSYGMTFRGGVLVPWRRNSGLGSCGRTHSHGNSEGISLFRWITGNTR